MQPDTLPRSDHRRGPELTRSRSSRAFITAMLSRQARRRRRSQPRWQLDPHGFSAAVTTIVRALVAFGVAVSLSAELFVIGAGYSYALVSGVIEGLPRRSRAPKLRPRTREAYEPRCASLDPHRPGVRLRSCLRPSCAGFRRGVTHRLHFVTRSLRQPRIRARMLAGIPLAVHRDRSRD